MTAPTPDRAMPTDGLSDEQCDALIRADFGVGKYKGRGYTYLGKYEYAICRIGFAAGRASAPSVPREPTWEMAKAGLAAMRNADSMQSIWRAMYDAAPRVQAQDQSGGPGAVSASDESCAANRKSQSEQVLREPGNGLHTQHAHTPGPPDPIAAPAEPTRHPCGHLMVSDACVVCAAPAPDVDALIERLHRHALPDPHDEREVMHAPLLREAAAALAQMRDENARLGRDYEAARDAHDRRMEDVARLTRERDEAQRSGVTHANYWKERAELAEDQRERTRDVWASRAERAEAERERLAAALRKLAVTSVTANPGVLHHYSCALCGMRWSGRPGKFEYHADGCLAALAGEDGNG